MILVVGLGNPGNEYRFTRHNVGFMLIDELIKDGFSLISSSKFQGELYKKGSLLLLKPQTFMNLSGNSVLLVSQFYKPEKIIVVHDDLDLEFGCVKFKKGGSSGGHNGIKSIDQMIGNQYERVRIGIGRPKSSAVSYVLSKFNTQELKELDTIFKHCKKAIFELLKTDIKEISAKFNLKPKKQIIKTKEDKTDQDKNRSTYKNLLDKFLKPFGDKS